MSAAICLTCPLFVSAMAADQGVKSEMSNAEQIDVGMSVYGFDERLIGPVEGLDADGLLVAGHRIPIAAIERVLPGAV